MWLNEAGPVVSVISLHAGQVSLRRESHGTNISNKSPDDVFKSTVHRAVNRSGVRRYSIPLFFGTDYNVRLEVRIRLFLRYFVFIFAADSKLCFRKKTS